MSDPLPTNTVVQVKRVFGNRTKEGMIVGYTTKGRPIVRFGDGTERHFAPGDVSPTRVAVTAKVRSPESPGRMIAERSAGAVPAPLVAVPKVRTARSSSHLEHVRSLPCAWCGKPGPSEPSHHGAHGMAIKASDYYTLPLCHEHHRGEWHQHGKLGHMSAEQTKAWATEQALRVCAERLSCRAAAQKESE